MLIGVLGGKCFECGSKYNLHVYRKHPLAEGVMDTKENLAVLCHDHYLRKLNHKTKSVGPRVMTSVSYTADTVPFYEKLKQILHIEGREYSEWVRDQTVAYVSEKMQLV